MLVGQQDGSMFAIQYIFLFLDIISSNIFDENSKSNAYYNKEII